MTFIAPCPTGFAWQENVMKCYSSRAINSILGSDTVRACKTLHPEATPVEPRNQIQMDTILRIDGMSVSKIFVLSICSREKGYLKGLLY